MSIETDTRDRVIRLEAQFETLNEAFKEAAKEIKNMNTILTEAKGGTKVLMAGAAFVGFLGGILSSLVPWLWPR